MLCDALARLSIAQQRSALLKMRCRRGDEGSPQQIGDKIAQAVNGLHYRIEGEEKADVSHEAKERESEQ
jgi:hypothetical protein